MGWVRIIYDDFERADESPIAAPWTCNLTLNLASGQMKCASTEAGAVARNGSISSAASAQAVSGDLYGTGGYIGLRSPVKNYGYIAITNPSGIVKVLRMDGNQDGFNALEILDLGGILTASYKLGLKAVGGLLSVHLIDQDLTISPELWPAAAGSVTDTTYAFGTPSLAGAWQAPLNTGGLGCKEFAAWHNLENSLPEVLGSSFNNFIG